MWLRLHTLGPSLTKRAFAERLGARPLLARCGVLADYKYQAAAVGCDLDGIGDITCMAT